MAKWVAVAATLFSAAVCLANDLSPVTFKTAPTHDPVRLVEQGRAPAKIIVMTPKEKVSEELSFAIKDLQTFVKLATGAELAIQYGGAADGPSIVLGDCDAAAKEGLKGASLPPEGFAIKTAPQTVFIVGRDENGLKKRFDMAECSMNGTAWGIYEFLERFVDVRWYFPGELGYSVPKRADLAVQPIWLEDAPFYRKRTIYPSWTDVTTPPVYPHHVRLRMGNSWPAMVVVHHPADCSPEFGKTRPEIFQLNADGTRNLQMLCFGNPMTLQTYIEKIAQHYDEGKPIEYNPDGNEKDSEWGFLGNAITVSPNDMPVACKCEYCRKLWNSDGGGYGTASRVVGQFVADLGRAVEKRWPDKVIIYLPYWNYTTPPEGIEFPKNVEIQLCGMPGLAQYKEPTIAASEQYNIDTWIKLSGRKVQNWHYSCWPEDRTKAAYLFPHTIKEFYQRNRDKIVGSFINGVEDHWPRQHISLYVWMKAMWNPDFDVDAAMSEYCRRMYGPAADEMLQLVKMQCAGWEESRWPDAKLTQKAIYEISYPRQDVLKMEALFAQAREKAKGDELMMKRLDYYGGPLQAFFNESNKYDERGTKGN
jgi:hypothetical protein